MCEHCGYAAITGNSSITHEASAVADAGLVIGYTAPNPLPTFTAGQIVQALRTSSLGAPDGNGDYPMITTTKWMYSQATFSGEITYDFSQNNTVTYPSGATTVRGSMSGIEQARIAEAMEIWDDFIPADIRQDASASITVFFATGGTGNVSPNNPGDTSGRAFARIDDYERNVNNIYGTEDYGIASAEINLGRSFSGGELDGINSMGVVDGGAFDLSYGQRGFSTILHEIGHTLGLTHPGFYNGSAPAPATGVRFAQDNLQNTIMSYFNEGAAANFRGINPSTPMVYDILAIQTIYQADTQTRTTDTVYGFGNTSGRGAYDFSATQGSVFTIWDAGGTDTLDASGFTSGVRIDLTPGSYSDIGYSGGNSGLQMIGNIGIAFNCIIENANGTSAGDTITGNTANNVLLGGAGGDRLYGGFGNDTLYAGTSAVLPVASEFDYLYGGDGSDKLYGTKDTEFYGEAGGDEVFLLGQMTSAEIKNMFSQGWLDGGTSFWSGSNADQDVLWLNRIQRSVVDIITKTGFTLNILDGKFESAHGSAGNDVLGGKTLPPFVLELNPLSYSLYGEGGNDQLNGNNAANYFYGGTGLDTLQGYGGDDRLFGGDDNDEIFGGDGTDSMGGEKGDDKLHIDYADTLSSINQLNVFFNGGEGYDIAYMEGAQGFVLDMGLREFEEAYGSEGGDELDGRNVNVAVTLDGRGGSDALRGSIYNDMMTDTGADLGDVFDGDSGIDTVSYDWYQGGVYINFDFFDTNYGRVDSPDSDIGIDTLQNIENIIGGNGIDVIYGSSANIANQFRGEAGADKLYGGNGNDQLYGGADADELYGEAGEDTLFGGSSNDVLDGGAELDTANYESETRAITVVMSAAAAGTATGTSIGTDTFTSIEAILTGSGGDAFYTAAGSETIGSGAGNDVFYASTGWDLYSGGADEDIISYQNFTTALTFTFSTDVILVNSLNGDQDYLYEFENIAGGAAGDSIEGNNVTNKLFGNAGADRLKGFGGDDRLEGGLGADILDGGTGVDSMFGGVDSDQYFVDNALDTVFEAAGGGTADRVNTAVSYALAVNQEIELFSTTNSAGLGAINLTGNNLANTILGNNGVNVLNGGIGIDRMTGLSGNDLYYVDNFSDVVIEVANGGTLDRVLTSVNYLLANDQQIELFSTTDSTGTTAINLVGNNLANRILGNNGANVMGGGLGNDVMTGGLGSDQFRFSTAITGGGNVDTITDFVHLTDDIQLAQSIFTGIGGTLDVSELRLGSSANAATQHIVYDGVTGNLFFDADGNGATAQVQFARVTAGTVLDINDFIMI